MSKIDTLTPEQEAKIPEYREKYLKIGLSTTPCDRAKAEEALIRSYAYQKLPPPLILWFDSPFEAIKAAAQAANQTEFPTKAQIQEQASKANYGSFEAYWVSLYDFIASELPVQKDELIDIVRDIVQNVGVYWTFDNVIIASEKPVAIHLDSDNKLHNPKGLALEYKDKTGIFNLHGVRYKSMMDLAIQSASETKKSS